MWSKIKAWLLESVRRALHKAIDRLDQYESKLANIVRENLNPEEKAKLVVDYVQDKLKSLVDSAFKHGWLHKLLVWGVKDKLVVEIDKLDKYEDDLADIARKNIKPDEQAKMVVDYLQNYLKRLVDKHLL